MFRYWGIHAFCPFYTRYVVIHSLSEWASCFSYVLFSTHFALNQIYDIAYFTCDKEFGEVNTFMCVSRVVAGKGINFT